MVLDPPSQARLQLTSGQVYLRQFAHCASEARKFTAVVKVLGLLIANLSRNRSTTKRDLYYQDVALFRNDQRQCNVILNSIAASFKVSLDKDLGVYSSSKGLVFGGPYLNFCDGASELRLSYDAKPVLVPLSLPFETLKASQVLLDLIIILEKDAVFMSLCSYLRSFPPKTRLLVVTGKGFPDKYTQNFLRTVVQCCSEQTPIIAFTDSDVYGLHIYRCYLRLAALDAVKWAGIFLLEYQSGWTTISAHDFRMMTSFVKNTPYNKVWHREITRGLLLFKKAEMNVVGESNSNDCVKYMMNKIKSYTTFPSSPS